MINLGPYPGKNCPDVHFRPTVIDRVLECAALIVVLATWVGIYWLYEIEDVSLSADVWMAGGFSVFSYLFMGIAGYLPIRFINFPVRVTERNVAVQYLLATRFIRVMTVILSLMFLGAVFKKLCALGGILFFVPLVLLGLAFAVYYILAFKYK